jgi:uracil-DNA glycosylase
MSYNPDHNTKVSMLISNGVVLAVGTIMVTLFLNVQKDSGIALSVVAQHGEELNGIRSQLQLIQESLRERTEDRYKATDAQRDLKYIERRLDIIEETISEHH